MIITIDFARKLIAEQFPEYASLTITDQDKEQLAFDLFKFLKELQAITGIEGPEPGQHNWWRGDHVDVYDKSAREQIAELAEIIDAGQALAL